MDRTACQTGMIAQNRIQRGLILTNKRTGTIVLMPVRAKRKEFPGGYDKNARFSVKMLSVLGTPSSYELEANASRSRARFFCGSAQKDRRSDRTTDPSTNVHRTCRTCAACEVSPSTTGSYLERRVSSRGPRATPFPLPSSGWVQLAEQAWVQKAKRHSVTTAKSENSKTQFE